MEKEIYRTYNEDSETCIRLWDLIYMSAFGDLKPYLEGLLKKMWFYAGTTKFPGLYWRFIRSFENYLEKFEEKIPEKERYFPRIKKQRGYVRFTQPVEGFPSVYHFEGSSYLDFDDFHSWVEDMVFCSQMIDYQESFYLRSKYFDNSNSSFC